MDDKSRGESSSGNRPRRRRVLIDTDAGMDDAIAIMMALFDPEVDVVGITCVSGNAEVHQVLVNIGKILEYTGFTDVPFFRGSAEPLVQARIAPMWAGHGSDGLGDADWLENPSLKESEENAQDAIIRITREAPTSIVALGPLTNLALATKIDPSLPERVEELMIMGGTMHGKGNTTMGAEFNFFQDPEAADVIIRRFSSSKIVILPWEICVEQAPMDWSFYDKIPDSTRYGKFLRGICGAYERLLRHEEQFILCDPCAMAVFLDRSIALRSKRLHASIELKGTYTRGMVLFDWYSAHSHEPNVELILEFDSAKFRSILEHIFTSDEPNVRLAFSVFSRDPEVQSLPDQSNSHSAAESSVTS